MGSGTILITGTTGHIGYAVLVEALGQGYTVRAAVRSENKAEVVRKAVLSKSFVDPSKLSFSIVPDITVPGAFDEAVKGVDYIEHIASPIPRDEITDYETELIQPAVLGTTSILHSALREPKIKKVVITSSVATLLVKNGLGERFTAREDPDDADGPYSNTFDGYRASKAKASFAVRDFVKENHPSFAITQILPGYVIGPNELATTPAEVASGSNATGLAPILGQHPDDAAPFTVVHLSDVVLMHLVALSTDPKYTGNFAASCDYQSPLSWNDANGYVKKHFPEAVKSGLLPANGSLKDMRVYLDTTEEEEIFGFKFKSWEQQVVDLTAFYIKVAEQSK